MTRKIMVAVDGSECSHNAFETAVSIMDREKDRLFVISVAEDATMVVVGPAFDMTYVAQMEQKLEAQALAILGRYAEICKKMHLHFTCLLAKGIPKDAIVNEASKQHIDLLVMGRRGVGLMESLLLGSVSEYCVANSPCSILVTHNKPATAPAAAAAVASPA